MIKSRRCRGISEAPNDDLYAAGVAARGGYREEQGKELEEG